MTIKYSHKNFAKFRQGVTFVCILFEYDICRKKCMLVIVTVNHSENKKCDKLYYCDVDYKTYVFDKIYGFGLNR